MEIIPIMIGMMIIFGICEIALLIIGIMNNAISLRDIAFVVATIAILLIIDGIIELFEKRKERKSGQKRILPNNETRKQR